MKTRIDNISAESVTIGDGSLWVNGEWVNKIRQPKSYNWEPQEDITAYELAQCTPAVIAMSLGCVVGEAIGYLPESCKRHFREVGSMTAEYDKIIHEARTL